MASLIIPATVNSEAAYAHVWYPPVVFKDSHPQSLTVSSESIMPEASRDKVTIASPVEAAGLGSVNGDIVATAKQYIGVPYVAYSADPNVGFDCSGFVMVVFAKLGVNRPHSADAQGNLGIRIPMSQARPGDLLVWEGQHVGIYVGDGMMIDSAKPGTTVNVRPIWGNPYVSRIQ